MRIDLTIRGAAGDEHDVAIEAPPGTTLARLRPALRPWLPDARAPLWAGRRALGPEAELGGVDLTIAARVGARRERDVDPADGALVCLHVIGGPDAGRRIGLAPGVLIVGRGAECALRLADPDVSRQHAEITVSAGGLSVRDLGSTNGTLVDSVPIGPGPAPLSSGAIMRVGASFLTVARAECVPAALRPGRDGTRSVSRAAHAAGPPRPAPVELPSAPARRRAQPVQWIAAAIPAALGIALALAMHMPQFLLFALLSPAMLLGTAVSDRLHGRRAGRRESTRYRAQLAAARAQVDEQLRSEARLRRARDPDPALLRLIATTPGVRLWERHRDDPGLMRVRLGLADATSTLQVHENGTSRPAGVVASVPATADLALGPLGIAGPEGLAARSARNVICRLAVLASPADVRFALLLTPECAPRWAWARWLPHLGGRVAVEAAEHRALIAELLAELERRRADRVSGANAWSGTRLVLVLDAVAALSELPGVAQLLREGPAVGITAVCVGDHDGHLPLACTSTARSTGEMGTCMRLDTPGGTQDVIADLVDPAWAEAISRALAPLRDSAARAGALPERCELRDLLGLAGTGPDALLGRWRRSDGRPATKLGLVADGPFGVDLARDGPHALIAGTTGAGKSELLRSLVTGLAVNHPPEEITFILIDYKGGAAFASCALLPHTVGLVTDLDSAATARALQSLERELRRREQLLAALGAKDIDDYHAGGAERLARLVLVVDEFAALCDDLPAFVAGLIGIAQRGRSLGVHLVLATQRPGGAVSPEIRANSALRIALRVTDPAESTDVIDTAQAAGIDPRCPGRAYVRTGTSLSEVQLARVCGPDTLSGPISVEPLGPWRRRSMPEADDQRIDTELDRTVAALREAARRSGRPAPARPWLEPLPELLPAAGLTTASDGPPEVIPIGRVDLPATREQPVLGVDLDGASSILFAGGPRSGRSTALLTLAITAASRLPPGELHVYAVDCGGGGLSPLAELAHCATLVRGEDFDPAARLLRRLGDELTRRRAMLADLGHAAVGEARADGHRIALLVVLIDGWEGLLAAAEAHDGTHSVEILTGLLREGPAAGMTIALSGDRASLSPRLASAVQTKLILRLTDPADYALAGIPAQAVPSSMPPGRALRGADGALVQLAFAGSSPRRAAQADAARHASAGWASSGAAAGDGTAGGGTAGAIRIRPLPARVTLRELATPGSLVAIGVAGDGAEPLAIDPFGGAARLLVAGPARSGRSNVLMLFAIQLLRQRDIRIVVAAPARSPLHPLAARHGLTLLEPHSAAPALPEGRRPTVVLIDDCERFLDTASESVICAAAERAASSLAVVAAGRNEDLAVSYRGIGAELRRARCGLLLNPEQIDGELLGVRLGRSAPVSRAGRGVLVADPGWGVAAPSGVVPVQVAMCEAPSLPVTAGARA